MEMFEKELVVDGIIKSHYLIRCGEEVKISKYTIAFRTGLGGLDSCFLRFRYLGSVLEVREISGSELNTWLERVRRVRKLELV
jgi:hypothetical protein